MRSFKNIGTSDYRRCTNTVVKYGESFTCAHEKEEQIIESEGCIGIRLEEVFPQEVLPLAEPAAPPADTQPIAQGQEPEQQVEQQPEATKEEPEVQEDETRVDIEVTPRGATKRSSSSKRSTRGRR